MSVWTAIRDYAAGHEGCPYQLGAKGPHEFDCSGLTQAAYAAGGITIGPDTYTQVLDGVPVSTVDRAAMWPGDLPFIDTGAGAQPGHVQLWLGAGQIIEAPHTGATVRQCAEWATSFYAVRRILTGADLMDITPDELYAQVDAFVARYGTWVWATEQAYSLPRGLLLAVGSRETGLVDEDGDGGHGRGVWQLDDRSHVIPADFLDDVPGQAAIAAGMLRALLARNAGSVDAAADEYNDGSIPYDSATTGGDYGADVVGRLACIQAHYPATPAPAPKPAVNEEDLMLLVRSTGNGGGVGHRFKVGSVFVLTGGRRVYVATAAQLEFYTREFGHGPVDATPELITRWAAV